MNWLSHAFLSPPIPRVQLGNLLADAIAPRDLAGLHPEYLRGVALHRAIDAATQRHPVVNEARRLLRGTPLRLTGIVTDVVWDHFLIRHWAKFSATPFDTFIEQLYALESRLAGELDGDPPQLMRAIVANDFLRAYRTLDGVRGSLARLARRMEARWQRPVPLAQAVDEVESNYAVFDAHFLALFPALADLSPSQFGS